MSYWKTKSLSEMTQDEWESLCDGCGKCCLHKLEDEETGEVYYTNVACRLMDLQTCRCKNYSQRFQMVPDCLDLRQSDLSNLSWLPVTCAYRLIAEGKELNSWHPLISGRKNSVLAVGVSIRSFAVEEAEVDDMEDHVIGQQI